MSPLKDTSDEATHVLPPYSHDGAAPTYSSSNPAHLTLTIDFTGTRIVSLPLSDDVPPLYTLNKTLLHVSSTASIHISRTGSETVLYAIGEHFMSPLHKTPIFNNIMAARSHGLLVTAGLRETVWDFSTRIPLPPGSPIASNTKYPTDPVYMIGTSGGPGTEKKTLLQLRKGEWLDKDDEVVAVEREGSVEGESKGMPVLSLKRELSGEWMDFLVACWCVSMWGTVKKRARRGSRKGSGSD